MAKKKNRQLAQAQALAQTQQKIIRQQVITSSFAGPLPPPDILVQYNNAVPDAAERIIVMAERQASHRMALEDRVATADIRRSNAGLTAGFVVALAGLGTAFFLVDRGHEIPGMTIGGIDLAGLVTAFVYGTVSRRSERGKRFDTLTGQ